MSETSQFDTREPFIIEILSAGKRICKLKYPSDAQWVARAAKQKITRTDIGRGKSTLKLTPLESFDFALFKESLMEPPEQEFDEFDASLVIDRLSKNEVVRSEPIGDDKIKFDMEVFGKVTVSVTLKQPRRRQVVEYGRASASVVHLNQGHSQGAETSVHTEASSRLFDQLFLSAEGYAEGSAIPAVHKDAIVVALIGAQAPE